MTAKAAFWDRRRPRYLFSGLMRCGTCGGGFAKISLHPFGCSTARNKGTCDNLQTIRRDVLEATVLDALRHRLMDPELYQPCSWPNLPPSGIGCRRMPGPG